jgi:hypothetical protein
MWSYVNWTSVDRAMPPGHGQFLVAVMHIPTGRRSDFVLAAYFDFPGPGERPDWRLLGDWSQDRGVWEITHWAPFPPPPPESIRDVLARERAVAAIDRGERASAG